jgi:hypothetical protein
MLGQRKFTRATKRIESIGDIDMSFDPPPQVDWRGAGIITAVKVSADLSGLFLLMNLLKPSPL